jgi:hypothetical protein
VRRHNDAPCPPFTSHGASIAHPRLTIAPPRGGAKAAKKAGAGSSSICGSAPPGSPLGNGSLEPTAGQQVGGRLSS